MDSLNFGLLNALLFATFRSANNAKSLIIVCVNSDSLGSTVWTGCSEPNHLDQFSDLIYLVELATQLSLYLVNTQHKPALQAQKRHLFKRLLEKLADLIA